MPSCLVGVDEIKSVAVVSNGDMEGTCHDYGSLTEHSVIVPFWRKAARTQA
ncbi:MAG: hypothetical protein NVSMB6_31620 [Burkholderiaceae bacterium]